MLWLFVDGTVGLALAIIALVEAFLDLVFWWLPVAARDPAARPATGRCSSPSEKSRLALRVEQLTESRAETVDTQAAELRRIERDLHDGAQARLVALGMSLAMAEEQFERDPDGARALLTEARTASSDALAELRDLVRGIHPPVLADRGLVGAVQALALAAPMPIDVRAEAAGPAARPGRVGGVLRRRRGDHQRRQAQPRDRPRPGGADATSGERLHARRHATTASGGADPAAGTGLRGIDDAGCRPSTARSHVESPPGGPTAVVMVLPCVSSSPKISPSSGTA